MGRDILFKTDECVFSYRVGGILIHNNKILLQRAKNGDHATIGGHVSFLETAQETLKREFLEELHAEIEVDDLMAVNENFIPWGDKSCHQICFYYHVHLAGDSIPLEGTFHGFDELDNERIDLDFTWVPLEEIRNGLPVYPLGLIPYILDRPDGIVHFITDELGLAAV